MRRVLIVGSGGAGKSTLAGQLAKRMGLPLIHLDSLYWQPGWIEPPPEEWTEIVEQLLEGEQWIMDGNYGATMEKRLAACDTVIFLDVPRAICLSRVIRRRIRFHNRARPDMPQGCPERLTWEFIRWIWDYPAARRPKILQRLKAIRPDQRAIVLRSSMQVREFLQSAARRPSR